MNNNLKKIIKLIQKAKQLSCDDYLIDLCEDISLHKDGFVSAILGVTMTPEESMKFCREHNIHNDGELMAYAIEHNINGNLENWCEKFIK